MRDYWRDLNKSHAGIRSLSAQFEAARLYEAGSQKGDGKGNRYGI